MPRARVLVLREKQLEVLPKVEHIFEAWLDSEEFSDRPARLKQARESIAFLFGDIEFNDEELENNISESEYHLAGLIARKLLDKDVPDTKPAWFAPWSE